MLKWAVTPRSSSDIFEQDGNDQEENSTLLTLQDILEQHQLPCLVRLIYDDINDVNDNYCLLLGETIDPYLIVSNETERFSIPLTFDGLFASVERGVTRYNILQSIHSLQSHLKSPSSSSSTFTHFTTLQGCTAYNNLSHCHIRPGTILERVHRSNPSPFVTSSAIATNRLRTLFTHIPQTLNKHFLSNSPHLRLMKKTTSSNDFIEVKSNLHDGIFTIDSNSTGLFVPIYRQMPFTGTHHRSHHRIQGLYTTNLLSRLTDQYPLITELIVSRTLEENITTTSGYPFRRITVHRLVENHSRIIAFDMKNYAFIELDLIDSLDKYAIEHDKTLFKRYQAQLRWCDKHLSSFRSQMKTILHSANGTAMFIQATPFHGQLFQQYHQRRNSSAIMSSPLPKHIPHTIFTPQDLITANRIRSLTPVPMKFYTTSNHTKYEQKRQKGKTTNINGIARKDVRIFFNDPIIQKHFQDKHNLKRHSDSRMYDMINGMIIDTDDDNSFQCTAL